MIVLPRIDDAVHVGWDAEDMLVCCRKKQANREKFMTHRDLSPGRVGSRRCGTGRAAHGAREAHEHRRRTSGGKLEEAFTAAYYKPFTAKTGIEIVSAVNTYSKLKAMVEASAVEWDVMQIDFVRGGDQRTFGIAGKAGLRGDRQNRLHPGCGDEFYIQCDVAAAVMSWNTKNVKPAQVPQTWAELWDMKRFSGQRGFWKQPFQTMEIALMADGVVKDKLYPIDVDRALKAWTGSSRTSSGGPAADSRRKF